MIIENKRAYFVEQGTNDIYFTFDPGIDKDKIYRWSRRGVIFGSGALGLGRFLDSWYAPISGTGVNIFLIFMLIFPCVVIYIKFRNYNEQYYIGKRPIPAMLEDWHKEKLFKLCLKTCKSAVIISVVSFIIAVGLMILFIRSSKTISYILGAMTFMMLAMILPYYKSFLIRIKIINKILKTSR